MALRNVDRRRRAALARRVAPLLLLWASFAGGQARDEATRNAARALADQGAERFDRRDWAGALELFRRAYALVPAPTIAVFEARCLTRLGRLVEADEAYARAEAAPLKKDPAGLFREAVQEARQESAALRRRIPRLKVQVKGAPADAPALRVLLDGKAVSPALLNVERPIDPGTHRVAAQYEGAPRGAFDVTLAEGERRSVTLRIDAPGAERPEAPGPGPSSALPSPAGPAEAPSSGGGAQRLGGWAALGLGGVGLAVGAVAGVLMVGKKGDLEDGCPGGGCPPERHGDVDAFRTLRTVSNVGYGVGLLGVGAGVVLLLTAPSAPPRGAWLRPWVGLGAAGVAGAF
ncbi:MAG TPA: hypothetical protein VFS43_31685 [Polyangiaceae bacterium]|nr:hypothetical protein [Polyangiaceae bacterium]